MPEPATTASPTEPLPPPIAGGRAIWSPDGGLTSGGGSHPRRRLALQGAVGLAAAVVFHFLHARRASELAGVVGAILLAGAPVFPLAWIAAIRRAGDALAHGVGLVVTAIVLGAVYVFFMIPVGLLSRGRAGARYQGRYERGAASYWRTRSGTSPSERTW